LEKMFGVIYKAVNKINKKSYIGQTICSLKHRISQHFAYVKMGSNIYFHRALKKYGKDNFEWEEIAWGGNQIDLNKLEIRMIDFYNTKSNGYNLTNGGDGNSGMIVSEKTKKIWRERRKGENNSFYNKHHTEEVKQKLSEINLGEKHPFYGKHHTEETRQKQSVTHAGEKNPFYNKHHTEDSRKKMSKSKKGERNPNYKHGEYINTREGKVE